MDFVLKIDYRKKEAKALVEYLKNLSFVQIIPEQRYNDETEKAIQEVREGKNVKRAESASKLFEDLGI